MASSIGSSIASFGASYIPDLTDTADIQAALKSLYFGSTGAANTSNGIYGALYTLYTGNPTLAGDVTITGNLIVNGTTTTINSTTVTVDDIVLELGAVATPTNTTANGGGISLLAGAGGNKTITWDSTNSNWTTSENWNLATGKTLKINNVDIASGTGAALVLGANASTSLALGNASGTTTLNGTLAFTNANKTMATLMGYTSTATAAGTTTLTNTSSYYQQFTGTTTQTVVLPVTSTLATGWTFHIVNNSTGNLTVNSSGGNLVITVIPGTTAMVTCIGTTLTTAADWESGLTDFSTYTGSGNVVMSTSPTLTNITTAAGTTTVPPLRIGQSTQANLLTTALANAIEASVEGFYATVANGPGRGLINARQMVYASSNSASSTNTTIPIFGASLSTGTLSSLEAAKLYRFKATYYSSFTYVAANSGAINILFAFSNAPQSFRYNFKTYPQVAGTALTQIGASAVTTATTVVPSQSASGAWVTEIEGYFVSHATNTSTLIPQFINTAASSSTAAMQIGSTFEIEKLGSGIATIAGNWA